ncbi:MAG: hypothetical protein NTU78_18470 [Alphaproteobacteria bacterium]|jgi:hypothetical protein|nr:hypothetical protein [Alphaproteobacteria bacterium]
MTRADFWCRVVGWLQIAGGLLLAIIVLFLWDFVLSLFMIDSIPPLTFLVWVFVLIMAVPMLLAGLFTVLYANAVEQAQEGLRGQSKALLRIVTALSGLWAAGVVGFAGLTVPPLGLFTILALITTIIAIMGPDWTADLFGRKESTA